MNTYRHTQFGTVIVVTTAAIIPLAALPAWLAGIATAAWLILGSMVVVLSLFASLTVEINAEHLRIRFGIGLIRKRFPSRSNRHLPAGEQPLDLWLGHPLDTPRLALQCLRTGSGRTKNEKRQDLSHRHG